MDKKLIVIFSLIIIMSVSSVNAFWWWDTTEVEGVPFKILDGFHTNELTGGDMLGFMNDKYTSDIYPNPVSVYVGIHSTDNSTLNESIEDHLVYIANSTNEIFVNESSKQIGDINTTLIVTKEYLNNEESFKYTYFFIKKGKHFSMSVNILLKDEELSEILNA